MDRPALAPLPTTPYEFAEWRKVRVSIDDHVQVHLHHYSVPYTLRRTELDARVTATTVELFHRGRRVAAHARSHRRGAFTTNPDHMPARHRAHLEWSPSRLITWARTHSSERLEAACRRALTIRSLNYRSVKYILDAGLDRLPVQGEIPLRFPQHHPHLRGPDYYRSKGHPPGE